MNRRGFLGVLGSGILAGPRAQGAITPQQFQARLHGPICSLPTVYKSDLTVDHEGIRRVVEVGVKSGSKVFALTAGNSQYDRLSYDEIKQLTRTLVEAVAGRGITIGATGFWWTGQAVDYAKYATSVGVDSVQVGLPSYGDTDMLYQHFQKIAAATDRAIVLHGQVPIPLLTRLMSGIPSIVAYKEEYPPMYSRDVYARFGKRLNLFGGGQKGGFLMYQPYGMHAYYSTFSTFAPQIPQRFWKAVEANDIPKAAEIALKYDVPFFRGTPLSEWTQAYWRATLEVHGIAKRFVRPPERALDDTQVAGVRKFQKELGLL